MLNKTEGNKPIASLQIDLLPYKYVGAEEASSAGRGTGGGIFARRASFLHKLILSPIPRHPRARSAPAIACVQEGPGQQERLLEGGAGRGIGEDCGQTALGDHVQDFRGELKG